MDVTVLVILGSIISIVSLFLGILTYATNRMTSSGKDAQAAMLLQKELQVKYSRIETDLAEIKAMITLGNENQQRFERITNENYQSLERRVLLIETNCSNKTKDYAEMISAVKRKKKEE